MKIIEELKKNIEGEIIEDKNILKNYSHDASIFEFLPKAVVYPKNIKDLSKLVEFANKFYDKGVYLTPRSGGTDMSGGAVSESIIIDMTKYFNNIKEIGRDYAIVEPGVYYRDFEKETLKHNLLLPSYPASREICTIGGMVANNSGGEKTLKYGKTDRYVKELKVILSDGKLYTFKKINFHQLKEKINKNDFEGKIYKKIFELISKNYKLIQEKKPNVTKNSTGYNIFDVLDKENKTFDLTKLFVGSQGTLGIITEIKFFLITPKKHTKMIVIFINTLKDLDKIVNTVLRFNPETFESYDDNTFKLAVKYLPSIIKIIKPKNIVKLAFKFLPEFIMIIKSGFPKLVLLAEFSGDDISLIDKSLENCKDALKKFKNIKVRIIKDEDERKKYLTIRRESFNLLRHKIKNKKAVPFVDDIIVNVEVLEKFLPELEKVLSPYSGKIIYTIAGHIGDGNFHIIPLMDLNKEESKTIIKELGEKVYNLVFKYKGSMSGEHNDGFIRGAYLKKMYGEEIYNIFLEIKKLFDPKNIFNRGKKLEVDFDYALSHIRKD